MEKLNIDEQVINDAKELTSNGVIISELVDKINEIIDWINSQ